VSTQNNVNRRPSATKDHHLLESSIDEAMPRGMTCTDKDEFRVRLLPTESLSYSNYILRADVAADTQAIADLAESIAASGIIQPLTVRPTRCGEFEVVAGVRRLMAARALGLPEIPCIVRSCSHGEALMISLTENLQRSDLNAIEKAHGLQKLVNEFCLTQTEIGRRIGMSQSAIAHHLRLLLLPVEVQSLVRQGTLSIGHGKLLAGIVDTRRAVELALHCASEGSSVRQLEELLARTAAMKKAPRCDKPTKLRLARELPNGVFLVIKESATDPVCGTIEIPYYSREEKSWVMAALGATPEARRKTDPARGIDKHEWSSTKRWGHSRSTAYGSNHSGHVSSAPENP
jgi:ParB family transcriptional regulator, chromosome partitioning protein